MGHRNDISYGRYVDSGYGMRYSDSDVDHPSDDSDVSAAPSRRSKGGAKSSRSRGPKLRTLNRWTPEEHERLAYLVSKWGSEKNWAKVAEEMPGRTGKQCRERWLNHMKPGIIKGNWSFEEEFLLAQCHAVVGSHWSKMTKRLPGRTENSIKNFWNATLRSKAPHKRRGILWLYMQQQTCQEGENVDAFLVSITRLYETQELPAYWAQLMEEGRLTERTLRAVLRAEKEFLENPDAELHPLAMPHPTHGLFGASDTGAATAPAAAAGPSGAPTPCPESDVGYDTGRQTQQNPSAPPLSDTSLAAAAAAAGGSYGPASPLPVPGLTPRFPGAEYVSVQHNSGAPASAAFDASTMQGLALPPEVLAALGPPEVWTALPSAQARVGPFGGAGSMEPLMPALGLNSDLRASGVDGAFGGNGGSSMLAAGHDSIWSCLPSLRGLGSTGCGVPAAAGAYTPGPAGDPLRLLEPYGALQGHHSSSTSIQTARPDSALDFEQQNAADSQGARRDSSSRPGSGMGPLRAEGLEPGTAAAGGESVVFKQASSMQGGAGSRPVTPEHPMHGLNGSYHSHHDAAAAGQGSPAQHPWFSQGGRLDAGMQAAAEFVLNAWGGHYAQQQQQEPQQQQQSRQQHDGRSSSPADSATQSDLAYGSVPGPSGSAAYQPSGHGPHCSCNVCCVRYQRGAGAPQHNSPNSNSLASSQALGSYVPWEQAVKGSSSYQQQQQQYNAGPLGAAAAWHSPASSGQQQADAQQQQQQQTLAHAASEGCLTAGNGSYQQHSLEPRMKPVNSAPLPASRLQHQNSSGHSPFARHANAVWDTAGSGSEAAAAYVPSIIEPPASTAGVQGGWDTQQGRGGSQEQQQQKEGPSRQQLQLGSLAGSTAGGLFSPRTAESPMSGALQHLLDSAAAQAGVRTEDICAWLAAANGPQAPGQEADREDQQQQEDAEQQPRHDWLTGPEFSALDNGHRVRARNGLDHLRLSTNDEQGNNMSGAGNIAIGAQDASFACSILEALLTSRHSSQLGDMLMSPAGIAGSAALLQSLPPTPAALSAATALHAAVAGLKRERSFPEPHDDADLLIEQPGTKLPRVF